MSPTMIAAGLAVVLAGCTATPQNGEKLVDDVRLQPVALSSDGGSARCSAHPVLMHRSRARSDWSATTDVPGTLYVPRNARVVELVCTPVAGGSPTTRYLASEETAEGKRAVAATGAMFLLLGGLPALATGAAQRTDVYAFSDAVKVDLPPRASASATDRSAYVARRATEVGQDTDEWHRLRWEMCKDEKSPGEKALDDHCENDLNEIKKRREQLLADLKAG